MSTSLLEPGRYEISVKISEIERAFSGESVNDLFTLVQSGEVVLAEAEGEFYIQSVQELRIVDGMLRKFEKPSENLVRVHYFDLETGMYFATFQNHSHYHSTTFWPTGMYPRD